MKFIMAMILAILYANTILWIREVKAEDKWTEMKAIVQNIQQIIHEELIKIGKYAKQDNEEIGILLSENLQAECEDKVNIVLDVILDEIQTKTLTLVTAKKNMDDLELIITKAHGNQEIENLIKNLNDKTKNMIYDCFDKIDGSNSMIEHEADLLFNEVNTLDAQKE